MTKMKETLTTFININKHLYINLDKMAKKYLTIKEAARLLGVTPLTLRNWEKRGKLIPYRHPFNKYRLYTYDQISFLLRWIESGNKIRDIK